MTVLCFSAGSSASRDGHYWPVSAFNLISCMPYIFSQEIVFNNMYGAMAIGMAVGNVFFGIVLDLLGPRACAFMAHIATGIGLYVLVVTESAPTIQSGSALCIHVFFVFVCAVCCGDSATASHLIHSHSGLPSTDWAQPV